MSDQKMFSQILQYIDENPTTKWSLDEMAKIFNYSPFHFHRLFKKVSGESFHRFVQKRRLSYSAQDLMDTKKRILEVALEYEYCSHEAFSRAFKSNFHLTPTSFKQNQAAYSFFEQNFLFHHDVSELTPSVQNIPAFTHVGFAFLSDEKIAEGWGRVIEQIPVSNYTALIGIIQPYSHDYIAGVRFKKDVPAKLPTITNISCSSYITMHHYGTYETILKTYEYLLHIWLPKSSFSYDDRQPQIEMYEKNKPVKVCLPVKERSSS